jgi:hypothetical protein
MRSITITVLMSLTVGATALPAAATDSFDRYQIIMDRKPFGEPPPVQAAPPPPPVETPPWAETYRLCSVYEAEGKKVRVGLLEVKTNKAMILAIGEAQNGIELLSADVGEESATLTKDGQEVTMKLEASKAKPAAAAARKPGAPQPASARITPPRTSPRTPARPPTAPRGGVIRSSSRR